MLSSLDALTIDRYLSTVPLLRDLSRRGRFIVAYAIGIVALIGMFTVAYNYGMRTLEGDPHSLFRSFQTVVETMTTTGYGADSPWDTPVMNVFVVFMQITGIALGFFTLRVLVIPLFKHTPVNLASQLSPKEDHVVICEYRRDSGVLLDELERLGREYVLIASDQDEAEQLSDDGYDVIAGDPERARTLQRASIREASLIVTDAGDRNASVVLTARQCNDDARLICLTNVPEHEGALRGVGADLVAAPHAVIGRRLALKAGAGIERLDEDAIPAGEDVEIREVLVRRDSPLAGRTIADSPFADHPDVTLVGAWIDGDLRLPPEPSERITPNAVLLVVGPPDAVADVREHASNARRPRRHTSIVVAGMGVGGRAALDALPDDADVTTIDRTDGDEVDVVGDVRDPATFERAGIEEATALVVTVDDDATALLAVALARTLTDEIDVLVRVTDTEKTDDAFDAGADYVLSVQRLTARLLAREVHGEVVLGPTNQIRLVRADAGPFVDATLADARRTGETDRVLVGVVRGGDLLTDDAVTVRDGDDVLVAGTDASIQAFEQTVDREQA